MRAVIAALAVFTLPAFAEAKTCERGTPVYVSATVMSLGKAELRLGPKDDSAATANWATLSIINGQKSVKLYVASSNGISQDFAIWGEDENIRSRIFFFDRNTNEAEVENATTIFIPDLPGKSIAREDWPKFGRTWQFNRCEEPVL